MDGSVRPRASTGRGILALPAIIRSGPRDNFWEMPIENLAAEAEEEAEVLNIVRGRMGDWDSEVEGQRRRTHRRNVQSNAESGCNPEIRGVNLNATFGGPEIAKYDSLDHVVGGDGKIILGRTQKPELTTYHHAPIDG